MEREGAGEKVVAGPMCFVSRVLGRLTGGVIHISLLFYNIKNVLKAKDSNDLHN